MFNYLYMQFKNILNSIKNSDIWEYNLYSGVRWDDYD